MTKMFRSSQLYILMPDSCTHDEKVQQRRNPTRTTWENHRKVNTKAARNFWMSSEEVRLRMCTDYGSRTHDSQITAFYKISTLITPKKKKEKSDLALDAPTERIWDVGWRYWTDLHGLDPLVLGIPKDEGGCFSTHSHIPVSMYRSWWQ